MYLTIRDFQIRFYVTEQETARNLIFNKRSGIMKIY
jgi:hypothetical protein